MHALCYMATKAPRNDLTTARELSEWMQAVWPAASATYLANVIQRLVRGGVLISQQGKAGGYSFARDPDEITLCDVVALLEGFIYARCILTPAGKCTVQHRCKNYRKLCQLHQRYTDMLA